MFCKRKKRSFESTRSELILFRKTFENFFFEISQFKPSDWSNHHGREPVLQIGKWHFQIWMIHLLELKIFCKRVLFELLTKGVNKILWVLKIYFSQINFNPIKDVVDIWINSSTIFWIKSDNLLLTKSLLLLRYWIFSEGISTSIQVFLSLFCQPFYWSGL